MIRALLIDMDDTLYEEAAYVRSGFRAVANAVADRFAGVSAEPLFAAMLDELAAHGRGKVFDVALAHAGIAATPSLIADLVAAYRSHRPEIVLWPGVQAALQELAKDYRLAIVTDGLGQMQRRKVEALGLAALVPEIVYCWELEAPKPDPAPFHEALRRLNAAPAEALVIGDNPGHDMAAAAAIGCRSIRVASPRLVAQGDTQADCVVAGFTEIPNLLRRAANGGPTWLQRP